MCVHTYILIAVTGRLELFDDNVCVHYVYGDIGYALV